jgi:hypothetical protein
MAKLIFNIDEDSSTYREASNIEFTVPNDMTVQEFKIVCARLASAIGYTNGSIKSAFGELDYSTESDALFSEWMSTLDYIHSNGYSLNIKTTGSFGFTPTSSLYL